MLTAKNSTKDLSEAKVDTAILSVGATEQCSPNLPLNFDTLVAEYYARAWGEALSFAFNKACRPDEARMAVEL